MSVCGEAIPLCTAEGFFSTDEHQYCRVTLRESSRRKVGLSGLVRRVIAEIDIASSIIVI